MEQATWQAETTWTGGLPSPAAVWELVHSADLSSAFSSELPRLALKSDVLRAGLAQHLAEVTGDVALLPAQLHAETGRRMRDATLQRLLRYRLQRARRWKAAFANLVSGRFTELIFERAYAKMLTDAGLDLIDETAAHSFLDFRVRPVDRSEAFELGINTKNAGVQMQKAEVFFGLTPEDTLPIATYKAFGQNAGVPRLYVY